MLCELAGEIDTKQEMDVVKKNCVTKKINLALSGIFLLGGLLLVPGVSEATRIRGITA